MVNMLKAILTFVTFSAISYALCQNEPIGQPASHWVVDKDEDSLRGKTYDRFVFTGRYLSPPSVKADAVPKMVVKCERGMFRSGCLEFGAVVDREQYGRVSIEMRFDDRRDTDGGNVDLVKFMTGKMLGHPSKREKLVRRLVIGTTEAFGGEIVMQFDMPSDHSEIIDACDLEWSWQGKKKH